MFKVLSFLILVTGISLGLTWFLENDGVIGFQWLGYEVTTSVSFFMLCLSLLVLALLLLLKIIFFVIYLPTYLRKRRDGRRLQQNLETIQIGYAALISGDIDLAKDSAKRLLSSKSSNQTIINLGEMLDAKVAAEEGNLQLAQGYFDKFMEDKKQRYFAVKSALDAAFKAGDIDKATELAEEAYKIKPSVRDGAHSILELYKKSGKLEKAEVFLNKYQRKHWLLKDKYNHIDAAKEFEDIWLNKAKTVLRDFENDKPDFALAASYLKKALQKNPNNLEALKLLLKVCKNIDDEPTARKFVEKAWNELGSYEIGAAYLDIVKGKTPKQTNKKRLVAVERLQKLNDNKELLDRLKDKIYDGAI